MASEYVRKMAEKQAKKVDKQFGKGAYGGSQWREETAKKSRPTQQGLADYQKSISARAPASSYAAAAGNYRTPIAPLTPQSAAISGVKNPETQKKVQKGMQTAAAKDKEARGKPFWEDMFAQDETYVDLAKKGDLAGAAANFIGSGVQALQSGYLNAINAGDSLLHGQGLPEFHYNMSKEDYDKEVVKRLGGGKTIGEHISELNPGLGMAYGIVNETLSDPTTFLSGGEVYDAVERAGRAKAGGGNYAKALQNGTFSQVPRVNTAKQSPQRAYRRPQPPRWPARPLQRLRNK